MSWLSLAFEHVSFFKDSIVLTVKQQGKVESDVLLAKNNPVVSLNYRSPYLKS